MANKPRYTILRFLSGLIGSIGICTVYLLQLKITKQPPCDFKYFIAGILLCMSILSIADIVAILKHKVGAE